MSSSGRPRMISPVGRITLPKDHDLGLGKKLIGKGFKLSINLGDGFKPISDFASFGPPLTRKSEPMKSIIEHLVETLVFADKLTAKHPEVAKQIAAITRRHGPNAARLMIDEIVGFKTKGPQDIPLERWPEIGVALSKKLAKEDEAVDNVRPDVPANSRMTPLALSMLLHFNSIIGPYAPEATRRSDAYVANIKYLLRQKLVERVDPSLREKHSGWAYKTTERGHVFAEALLHVPLPVEQPQPAKWIMPS